MPVKNTKQYAFVLLRLNFRVKNTYGANFVLLSQIIPVV